SCSSKSRGSTTRPASSARARLRVTCLTVCKSYVRAGSVSDGLKIRRLRFRLGNASSWLEQELELDHRPLVEDGIVVALAAGRVAQVEVEVVHRRRRAEEPHRVVTRPQP